MATLAEIRAKLQAQADKQNAAGGNKNSDTLLYPFWNIKEGDSSVIRFLPDGNKDNTYFWVEKAVIKLPFSGVKGQSDKPVIVQVPCMEMWNEPCPILAEVRNWFKDDALADMGRKYWKKRTYLYQGFVRKNSLADDETPANPIRKFVITPQLFALVKASLMDPELEEMPTDYANGLDFHITKTSKGGFADYSTSKWSRKVSALTSEEQAAIDQYGLFNIADWLPKKPTEGELVIMKEMFEASVDGQQYDLDKWGKYFKPFGKFDNADAVDDSAKPEAEAAPAPKAATPVAAPKVETPTAPASSGGNKAEDILQMIRNRQKTA